MKGDASDGVAIGCQSIPTGGTRILAFKAAVTHAYHTGAAVCDDHRRRGCNLFSVLLAGVDLAQIARGSFLWPPIWIPLPPHPENYCRWPRSCPLLLYIRNSVFIAGMVIVGTLFSCSLAAYSLRAAAFSGAQCAVHGADFADDSPRRR